MQTAIIETKTPAPLPHHNKKLEHWQHENYSGTILKLEPYGPYPNWMTRYEGVPTGLMSVQIQREKTAAFEFNSTYFAKEIAPNEYQVYIFFGGKCSPHQQFITVKEAR